MDHFNRTQAEEILALRAALGLSHICLTECVYQVSGGAKSRALEQIAENERILGLEQIRDNEEALKS